MAVDPGREIAPGVFYERVTKKGKTRVDRFIVRPGITVPLHGNARGRPYTLVACNDLEFSSLDETGTVRETRRMEAGESLERDADFRHQVVNRSDKDLVLLKIWDDGDEGQGGEGGVSSS